ncbi:MAG TPA: hypothetical protein VE422_48225 [Terriglobia bacterium]|nr:hypothetical protein [Terriglobia bacterium]
MASLFGYSEVVFQYQHFDLSEPSLLSLDHFVSDLPEIVSAIADGFINASVKGLLADFLWQ